MLVYNPLRIILWMVCYWVFLIFGMILGIMFVETVVIEGSQGREEQVEEES